MWTSRIIQTLTCGNLLSLYLESGHHFTLFTHPVNSLFVQEVLGKELCDFQNYIDKMKSETKDIKSQLANKTEELNDEKEENEKLKTDHGKQVAKLVKQQETLKNKLEKITEEKKEKMTHIKEITKLHKELESDQRSQIQRLTKENEELKKKENQIVSKADSKVYATIALFK
jgi:septal ring factor EnvC (AmiA/AmiB activator)